MGVYSHLNHLWIPREIWKQGNGKEKQEKSQKEQGKLSMKRGEEPDFEWIMIEIRWWLSGSDVTSCTHELKLQYRFDEDFLLFNSDQFS